MSSTVGVGADLAPNPGCPDCDHAAVHAESARLKWLVEWVTEHGSFTTSEWALWEKLEASPEPWSVWDRAEAAP